ncbi:MAG TPA: HlyD family secretion protein [Rhizomicrobium sp.]|nr:HlyD family secretion protein [Rhizomicrobium sp.]
MADGRERTGDARRSQDARGRPPDDDRYAGNERNSDRGSDEDGKGAGPAWIRSPLFKYCVIVVVVLLLIVVLIWWLNARQYEDTDDAFIDTHIVHISPQIAGQVIQIAVHDNEAVRRGQLLVQIDPADPTAKLNQAKAQLTAAQTQLEQAAATEEGAEAQAQNAAADLARYRLLQRIAPSAVAQEQIDQAVASASSATAQRDAAKAQILNAEAQIKLNRAEIVQAQLNLGHTRIVAPIDGHIAQKSVALGDYVTPGQELLAIVPLRLWVTANFKETQLTHMRVGQPVTVTVDACGSTDIRGHVDSIQRGAGQAFQILPPENATGNFVKVVQRVPVKILLDRVPKNCVLGPGMSVEPSVKVR